MQQKYREKRTIDLEKRQYEVKALESQNEYLEAFLEKRRKPAIEVVEPAAEEEDQ